MPKKNQWDNPKYKYEIVEKKDKPMESLILKTGISAKFSMNDVLRDVEYFKNRKKELEAKINMEEAIMKNVLQNYPEVEKTEERVRMAYLLYQRSFEVVKQVKEQLEIANNGLEEEAKQIDDIAEQTGVKIFKELKEI